MSQRVLVLAGLLLLLATARIADVIPTDAAAAAMDDADDADPAGLIVFHVHADGRLHLHLHLFGGLYVYLSAAPATSPPAVTESPPSPGSDVALVPSSGSQTEQLVASLGSLVRLSLRPGDRPCCTGRLAVRRLLMPPPDPPPRA